MPLIRSTDAPWRELNTLLQRGVWCRARTPVSLLAFLTDELGLERDYVRTRIETIFLDGLVVDDLEASVVHDGSTVTLSAAMPGLVGATLRRGGFYKAMRREISWSAAADAGCGEPVTSGLVRVKLFNLILRECGPQLLRRGVFVDREVALEVLGAAGAEASGSGGRVLVTLDDADARGAGPCA